VQTIARHNTSDTFSYTGLWWFPEQAQTRVPGILSYSPSGIGLKIFGDSSRVFSAFHHHLQVTPVILGEIESATPCTLLHTTISETGTSSQEVILDASWLFIGTHFSSPDAIAFRGLNLTFLNLDQWMFDRPVVEEEPILENNALVGFRSTLPLDTAPDFIQIPALNSHILFGRRTSHSSNLTRHTYEVVPEWGLSFADDKNLLTCFDIVNDSRAFLTLLAGGPTPLQRFVGQVGQGGYTEVQVFFHDATPSAVGCLYSFEMPFTLPSIREDIPIVVPRWFERCTQLRTVTNLFTATYYNEHLFLEFQFLSLAQAIELFSRLTTNSLYLSQGDYEKIRQVIAKAIPPGIDSDLRRSLLSRLKYGNEHSLRKRIKALLMGLEENTRALICNHVDGYVDRLVATRNRLTHYGDDPSSDAWTSSEWFHAIQSMRVLMSILLLKEVGLTEQRIREGFARCNNLRGIIPMYLAQHLERRL
jgi:hypothetical protein